MNYKNGMILIRESGKVKITNRTFRMLSMKGKMITVMKQPLLIVVMKQLNSCWMNKQPQQYNIGDIFNTNFQNSLSII